MNIETYKALIDKIAEYEDKRTTLEQFAATGGRFKLAVKCDENPAIGAMLTELSREINVFEFLISRAVKRLHDYETHYRKAFIDEAVSEAAATGLAREMDEAGGQA